jgi:CBS domain containing-hemolysin-like protein
MSDPGEARRSPLMAFVDRLAEMLGAREEEATLRESMRDVLDEYDTQDSALTPEARLMLMNILSLGEIRVEDVMVPRADIAAIEIDTSLDDTIRTFRESGHARLPVYREMLDDPVGFVDLRSLIAWWPVNGAPPENFSLEAVVRELLFVPPSMPVADLLLTMRTTGTHLALVIDEYGGTDGLVTIADLIEEIVGKIDYGDTADEPVIEPAPGGYIADARVPIDRLEELTGLTLVDQALEEEIDTIGGLIGALVGRVPQQGERVEHPAGLLFEIVDADPGRVKRVRIHRLDGHDTQEEVS